MGRITVEKYLIDQPHSWYRWNVWNSENYFTNSRLMLFESNKITQDQIEILWEYLGIVWQKPKATQLGPCTRLSSGY